MSDLLQCVCKEVVMASATQAADIVQLCSIAKCQTSGNLPIGKLENAHHATQKALCLNISVLADPL